MKTLISVAILFLTANAFATSPEDAKANIAKIDATEDACLKNEENQSTAGMRYCLGASYEELDTLLNRVYKEMVAELKVKTNDEYQAEYNKEALARLQKSQRAWIQFRGANADLSGMDSYGGSLEGIEILQTFNKMTRERIVELTEVF